MPRFPTREDKIIALAQQMKVGLMNNLLIWPNPPFRGVALRRKRDTFLQCHNLAIAARAAAASAYTAQQKALDDLAAAVKRNLRYAENTVNFDDHKLKLIGWSARHEPRPAAPPGQVRQLKVIQLTNDRIKLIWQPPLDGGMVDAYEVQHRRCDDDSGWCHIAAAVTNEITLRDQLRGVNLEYRIRAINKVGYGRVSNTAMIKL